MGEKGQPLGYTADQWTQPHVTYQPGSSSVQVKGEKDGITWVPRPTSIPPNCPPGLEYLTTIDQLLVEQKVRLMEVLIGFEQNNKYMVRNSSGQQVYFAAENSDCCSRNFIGATRQFDMHILDNVQREVIHLFRPFSCAAFCFGQCYFQEMEVASPPGTPIGYVVQEWDCCTAKFRIENAKRENILRVEGPKCTWVCCGDVEFQVLSVDGSKQVGTITKKWSGFIKEAFTDADNFGIQFPMDLDVTVKATLLGALFLIDFMFFEHNQNG